MKRNSFVFFTEWIDIVKDYPCEVRLEVYDAIFAYLMTGEEPEIKDAIARNSFAFIRRDIDRINANYEKKSAAGEKGGAPKGNRNAVKVKDLDGNSENGNNQKQPKTTKNNQKQPKTTKNKLNENENENVNVNVVSPTIVVETEKKEDTIVSEKKAADAAPSHPLFSSGKTPPEVQDAAPQPPSKPRASKNFTDVMTRWNTFASEVGLPKIQGMSAARRRKFALRMSELGVGETDYATKLDEVLQKVKGSGFLMGENDRGWKASFDFLLERDKMLRVLEGTYDAHGRKPSSNPYERIVDGQRVYGERNIVIPNDAPPRPYADSIWDKQRQMWITE